MTIQVKEWFFDKVQDEASKYNLWIDVLSRDENGVIKAENGYFTVRVDEVIKESEKAIYLKLSTGSIVGSATGWKTWIPKSVVK